MAIMKFASVALKNLFHKPVTTAYPAAPIDYPERSRGHIEIDIQKCISCGACQINCPPGAIKVDRNAKTWTINRMDCIQCGACTYKCPTKCLSIVPGYQTPDGQKVFDSYQHIMTEEEKQKAAELEAKKKAALAAASAAAAKKAVAEKTAAAPASAAKKAEAAKAAAASATASPAAASSASTSAEKPAD